MVFNLRQTTCEQDTRFSANVRYMLSPVRLSVCRLSVIFVHPTQAIEIFGNVSKPLNTLAIY